jgi:leucyl aminopeptidase
MVRVVVAAIVVLAAALTAPTSFAQAPANPRGAVQAAAPVQRVVSFAAEAPAAAGTLVLPLAAEADLAARASGLSAEDTAAVQRALTSARFTYGARSMLSLRGIGAYDQILVIGLGADPALFQVQRVGAAVGRRLMSEPGAVTIGALGLSAEAAAEFAIGMGLGEYRSDLYRTRDRAEAPLEPAVVVASDAAAVGAIYERRGRALIAAMAWTRDISNEPGNAVYPESFVARTRTAFRGLPGVTIEVLDVRDMERLGMGALLGVGQGSARPPRLLVVRYRGEGAPAGGPIVLVGKGITFDSGGISIKPAAGMHNMRMDMSGAASVTGAVLALARSGAPVDVVAVSALAENMPDAAATRPGDVLTAMNGMTIEIINTDAEGRLVLVDAIIWAERTLDPAVIVDVATLTGSVRGALGDDYAGLFSRHDGLAEQLGAAGDAVGEPLWRLPLHSSYASDMASPIADIRNTGGEGTPGAGIGAHFIGAFVEDTPWAHLDIANMAWGGPSDTGPDGSAGFGVRLLERFVLDYDPVTMEAANNGLVTAP